MIRPPTISERINAASPVLYLHAKVLIAEDEAVIPDTLSIILARSGYRTRVAYSAEEALSVCAEFQPDAIITEAYYFHGMNGLDLAKRISVEYPQCKIFLYTAWQTMLSSLLKQDAYSQLGFKIWAKPIHPTDIMTILADMLIPGPAHNA